MTTKKYSLDILGGIALLFKYEGGLQLDTIKKGLWIVAALVAIEGVIGCGVREAKPTLPDVSSVSPAAHATSPDILPPAKSTSTSNTSTNPIEIKNNSVAAQVPIRFYKDVVKGDYSAAGKLLAPDLKFEVEPRWIKYLKNIYYVKFDDFKDISSTPGLLSKNDLSWYRVKVYYAVMQMKVHNPNLVPALQYTQFRQFVVVQKRAGGKWYLEEDEDTPPR
jgi:hypothetical protein